MTNAAFDLGKARLTSATHDLAGRWQLHGGALAIAVLALLCLFAGDVRQMVDIWINASTYNHCGLVVLLAGWAAWQRRTELAVMRPSIWWPGLVILSGGSFLWLVGETASVAFVRQTALVIMLQSMIPLLLGKDVARGLLFPLFYLYFAIPFGEELLPTLQLVTAEISVFLLDVADVPAIMNGIFISTPNGYYKVAEACAGIKFLLAMLSYGALVANICFRTWHRRLIFMALCLIFPILANGVRAYATIHVGYLTTPEFAGGLDHIIYGWVFFAVVMALIIAAGWPFFERKPGDPWLNDLQPRMGTPDRHPALALGIGLALPTFALGWSIAGSALGAMPFHGTSTLPAITGWQKMDITSQVPWVPRYIGADRLLLGHYRNSRGEIVELAIVLYSSQDEGREIVGYGQGAAGLDDDVWVWSSNGPMIPKARSEVLTAPGAVERLAVTWFHAGGRVTGSAADVKWETLKAKLFGRDQAVAALILSSQKSQSRSPAEIVSDFRGSMPSPETLLERALAEARR